MEKKLYGLNKCLFNRVTHTLAIDKRACSIFAIILSISEPEVGAHVTVAGGTVTCGRPDLDLIAADSSN